ncbi:Uncharacterized protein pbN1_00165 [Aromatoleum bremense]|nr:Uncharacterized protein pbN1_00165 [Aromatoleum bremense]
MPAFSRSAIGGTAVYVHPRGCWFSFSILARKQRRSRAHLDADFRFHYAPPRLTPGSQKAKDVVPTPTCEQRVCHWLSGAGSACAAPMCYPADRRAFSHCKATTMLQGTMPWMQLEVLCSDKKWVETR